MYVACAGRLRKRSQRTRSAVFHLHHTVGPHCSGSALLSARIAVNQWLGYGGRGGGEERKEKGERRKKGVERNEREGGGKTRKREEIHTDAS